MSTVLPECETPELIEKDCISLSDEDNSVNLLTDEVNSVNLLDNSFIEEEDCPKVELSVTSSSSEEENVTDIENEILLITNILNCEKEENDRKNLLTYIYNIISCFCETLFLLFNMVCSDINTIFEFSSRILALTQQRLTKKILKHLFLFTLFIVTIVHSRNHGGHTNFEANRLFPRHSLITDFFQGELSLLRKEIFQSDMTVVMYYAPWDRQSQNFVPHFLKAAKYYHEQVSFAAINCWLPRSECKGVYKFLSYPVVVLHVKISSLDETLNVPFNGPLSAHHLIRFISRALRPFIHITSEALLLSAQLQYQVLVLGYYEVGNFNREFLSFYYAAISSLQNEQRSNVRYAVLTDPQLATKFSFPHRPPSIHLVMWNKTLVFPDGVEKNSKNISHFVEIHSSEVIHWLHISGRKSLALNRVFQKGPFMILFTPDNPYHTSNDLYRLARSVALEYHSCHQSALQTWLLDRFQPKTAAELRESDRICRDYVKHHVTTPSIVSDFQQSRGESTVEFDTCEREMNFSKTKAASSLGQFSWNIVWTSFVDSDSLPFGGNWFKSSSASFCSNKNESLKRKELNENDKDKLFMKGGPHEDDRITQLLDWVAEGHCRKLVLGSSVAPPPVILEEEKEEKVKITGLSCQTNRTLHFVAVDTLLHKDFAQQFGISMNDAANKLSGVAIIDPQMEERYIMEQPLSKNRMASFVYNFTNNLLTRGKLYWKTGRGRSECAPGEVCILELDSKSYREIFSKPKQAAVVLHYSHHCGACSAIAGALLTCQHLSSGVANLTFARIDVSKNTLPWHLTFELVPTIIFYPHDDQANSRVFDRRLPPTVKNLMAFILAGLRPPERNSLAFKLCNAECKKTTASRSLLLRIKLHHSIGVLSSRLKRIVSLLVEIELHLKQGVSNSSLHSKYQFYNEVENILSRKLIAMKLKLSHLNQIANLYPIVPLEFSNKLSFETKLLEDKASQQL